MHTKKTKASGSEHATGELMTLSGSHLLDMNNEAEVTGKTEDKADMPRVYNF
jgi:hypothetical protein